MTRAALLLLLVGVAAFAGCEVTNRFKYSCEGKCSGELSRDGTLTPPERNSQGTQK